MVHSCSENCGCIVVNALSKLLANTYCLLLQTQNVHWNVKGKSFMEIHKMTEEHYNDLFEAIDEIAEQIVMIGCLAPATFEEFISLSSLSDKVNCLDSNSMLKSLLSSHETIVKELEKDLSILNEAKDSLVTDTLCKRLSYHKKIVWMLKEICS